MKIQHFMIVSITVFLLIGCAANNSSPSSGSAPGASTECEAAQSAAAAAGATLIYCDEFNQSAGKLSTISSEYWMDQN